MDTNRPNKNFHPHQVVVSPEESELVFARVEQWFKSAIIDEAGDPEYVFGDYDGKKYTPEQVGDFVAKFTR